jgi:hypothetical protein
MRRLERILACFVLGGLGGSIVGTIGGLFDKGSLFILVPSGNPFWAIVGAFIGSVAGALYGAFSKLKSKKTHFINTDETSKKSEKYNQQ